MGLSVTEINTWAHNAVDALSKVEWFNAWVITYRTTPLSIVKRDIEIALSRDIAKFCRLTTSTKPSEARRRIEEHMTFVFDGKTLYINIDGGDGVGIRTKTVELRCEIPKEEQNSFVAYLKFALKYSVEAYRNESAKRIEKFGKFD